ncbi:MAG TPA: hypothetical protein VK465_07730 [Fibrobacteria bacterium]|nr:hypothetical protein [Fibrobacteria bacterium]
MFNPPHLSVSYILIMAFFVDSSMAAGPKVPAKVKETFSAIHALEDIYYNEYLKYAPDLQTLKKHFEVKDPIEYLAPGYEIYAGVKDSVPFLYALDEKGDSLTQIGRKEIRISRLNQREYPIDNVLGVDPEKGLQVRLEIPSDSRLKGDLIKDRSICSFAMVWREKGFPDLEGCSEYLTVNQTDSGFFLLASLPASILVGAPWTLSIHPAKNTPLKGSYHSNLDRPYHIRGSHSPQSPFRIYTRAETRRKQ